MCTGPSTGPSGRVRLQWMHVPSLVLVWILLLRTGDGARSEKHWAAGFSLLIFRSSLHSLEIKSSVLYMYCEHFLPLCELSFHFLNDFLWWAAFNCHQVQFIISFSFTVTVFSVFLKISLLMSIVLKIFYVSSINFRVLVFIFRSMINLKCLCVVWSRGGDFVFSAWIYSCSRTGKKTYWKIISFLPLNCFGDFAKNLLSVSVKN